MRCKKPQRDPHEHKAVAFVRYLHASSRSAAPMEEALRHADHRRGDALGVPAGWVECVGGHGVALTDIGRQMVHHWERAKQVKRGLRVADKRARPYWDTAIAAGRLLAFKLEPTLPGAGALRGTSDCESL